MNLEYCSNLIQKLLNWGVAEFYVCSGIRNLPIVEAVASINSSKKICFSHYDERSAAFFALGRIKSLGQPVCVLVTSGTAAGELLPATMEAYYSGLPLVLLTADRPERYRGTGAPQTAEQNNLFGQYVSECIDLTNYQELSLAAVPKNRPLHINVCLDVPLISGALKPISQEILAVDLSPIGSEDITPSVQTLTQFLNVAKAPLVIVSRTPSSARESILKFLQIIGAPVYAEGLSGLRECEALAGLQIFCADKLWANSSTANYEIDAVLKIGHTPTHRIWRDLDEQRTSIKVLSVSDLEFSGTPQANHITTDLSAFFTACSAAISSTKNLATRKLIEADRQSYEQLQLLVERYPNAEQSWFFHLSKAIPKDARVFLGNSLPIRTWDLAAVLEPKNFQIEASRGLNGIDGQISSFLGFADAKATSNWGIFGDLTTLYDFSALWMLQQLKDLQISLVVINNAGGMIFNRLVGEGKSKQLILNQHSYSFEHFANFWKLDYQKVSEPSKLAKTANRSRLIEILPDAEQTKLFAKEI